MFQSTSHRFIALMLVSGVVLTGLAGCGSKDDEKESSTREGTVYSINAETGEVAMSTYIAKLGKTTILRGKLAPNVEIWIDGKIATVDDVQVGDKVKVEGYKQKDQIYATRVHVIRQGRGQLRVIEKGATTQPADGDGEQ